MVFRSGPRPVEPTYRLRSTGVSLVKQEEAFVPPSVLMLSYAYNVYYVKSHIGLGIEDPFTRLAAIPRPKWHVTDHIGFLAVGTLQPFEYG